MGPVRFTVEVLRQWPNMFSNNHFMNHQTGLEKSPRDKTLGIKISENGRTLMAFIKKSNSFG
jgi:hypothetical protein